MDKRLVLKRMDDYASRPDAFEYTPFGYSPQNKPRRVNMIKGFNELRDSEFLSLGDLFRIDKAVYLQPNCNIFVGVSLEEILSLLDLSKDNIRERPYKAKYKGLFLRGAEYSEDEEMRALNECAPALVFYDSSNEKYWRAFHGRVIEDYFGFSGGTLKTIITQTGFALRLDKGGKFFKVLRYMKENKLPLLLEKAGYEISNAPDTFYTINLI